MLGLCSGRPSSLSALSLRSIVGHVAGGVAGRDVMWEEGSQMSHVDFKK